ncbi:PHP domain-containing protein [Paenibacillus sp. PR3]|uniref:PHP domain-containing protein n=1 Tax=Paenibacillus terricola TaxID=2763503 RepID=A0ABR8MTD1_9BACL|nr:PHP domain-containing protein [Paenibacillus terricola]MBD3918135.1 PHP domain-containing protein [Paenibacillus terricola]
MVVRERADLHAHSTASDGTNAPAVVVRLAKEAGLAAVALTDHDTMAGCAEAVAEGSRIGIQVMPGIELSTAMSGRDIHILGYWCDTNDVKWQERIKIQQSFRGRRNLMMIEKLQELGIAITLEEVLSIARRNGKKADSAEQIGRPHLAEALIERGAVADMKEAFDRYLGEHGAAYCNPPRPTPIEAVDWIREAGGVCVIAHPGLYGDDAIVEEIVKHGVHGIEVYHSDHSTEDEQRYSAMAERYGLVMTGGSDFHGEKRGVVFHGPLGGRSVDISVVEQLKQFITRG